ncbi:MAG TPA: isoprenylcysteine carboxylmethyltransferase family protein [Candidatus Cybelea sp.]
MAIYYWCVLGLWLLFIAVWVISSLGAKASLRSHAWARGIVLRLTVVVLVLVMLRLPSVSHGFRHASLYLANRNPALGIAGVALCALGIGLAIDARFYLGSNWGLPMTRKANPELITSGPYAFVRHPIYTGILLAMVGSALAESITWALALLIFGPYFIHSARIEERTMAEAFPEQYPAYRAHTKMLIPFVF